MGIGASAKLQLPKFMSNFSYLWAKRSCERNRRIERRQTRVDAHHTFKLIFICRGERRERARQRSDESEERRKTRKGEEELSIKEHRGNYTAELLNLLYRTALIA